MTPKVSAALNKVGATASFVCAIHCLAMPFVFALLPAATTFLKDERIEWGIIGFTVLVGMLSLLPSYIRHHKQIRPLALFIFGLGIILGVKMLIEEGGHLETPGMILGALFVGGANLLNNRLCHTCPTCEHAHE